MNGKDIFRGMQYVKAEYLEEAEFGAFSQEAFYREDAPRRRKVGWRRVLLVAAAIALAAALVGCGIVYVLKMQDLKLGDQQVTQERWDQESKTMVYETVSQQVLTFAGLKGTPGYEAAKEWYEFKKTYDPDWKLYHAQQDGTPDYGPAEYATYNCYTQEMRDKVDEITQKYGLKRKGAPQKSFQYQGLLDYLGMGDVFREDAKVSYEIISAGYYDGGWFQTDMHMKLTETPDWPYQFLCSLYYSPKDVFDSTVCELNETQDWQEWNYTTQSGYDVLVIRSPSVWVSWVFCDRGDATITLRMETILEWYSDDSVERIAMTDGQMKQVIDTIDFSIQPQPGDASLLEAPAASASLSQTSNGYTVTVKEVTTDGHITKIRLGLTGPEGTDLEQYSSSQSDGRLGFKYCSYTPQESIDSSSGGRSGPGVEADGDGKANTVDFSVELYERVEDGVAYRKGSVWNLYLEDLEVERYNNELMQTETLWEQEGTWNFQITMDHGDWNEIEFISEPIATNVCYGWDMDGNDVYRDETITSLKLRAFGGSYTAPDALGALDFANYREEKLPLVVLKDGTKIRLDGSLDPYDPDTGMIPLEEVVRLELIDGTVLYPTEADPDRATDYQLEVKSAVTDGRTAQVVLKLTVPYGTELCKENCEYSIGFDNFGDYNILIPMDRDMPSKEELMGKYALGETLEAREDGDGREDTLEIVYTMYVDAGQDSYAYFTPGSPWLFHIENMRAERMHYPEGTLTETETLWTTHGVRNVDVTLEETDYLEKP